MSKRTRGGRSIHLIDDLLEKKDYRFEERRQERSENNKKRLHKLATQADN